MVILEAIILGLIQGLTEFIPISSSAHLVVVPWLFGWNDSALTSLPFDMALHLGTLVAVLIYFAADWVRLLRAGFSSIVERRIGNDVNRRMIWYLVIGCIPGGIVGLLLESKIDELFHQPNTPIKTSALIAMAVIIALLALALWFAERYAKHVRKLENLTFKDVLTIGCAQALAVFPGVSRSGGTITAGLALGLEREAAARFSFLLGTPLIAGIGLKSIWDIYEGLQAGGAFSQTDWILFPLGMIVAAVSGYLCIKYLLQYLQKNSTRIFIYYRWAFAVLIVVVALIRA